MLRMSDVAAAGLLGFLLTCPALHAEQTPSKPRPNKPRASTKSKADEQAEEDGAKQPAWWDKVEPQMPAGINVQDIDQLKAYLRDVIRPDEGRHLEGIRTLHEWLDKVKGNTAVEAQVMDLLGQYYVLLLQDFSRSLYWWQQAAAKGGETKERTTGQAVAYAAMGVEREALKMHLPVHNGSGSYTCALLDALNDAGEYKTALRLGSALAAGSGLPKTAATMSMADAARRAGNYQTALKLYDEAKRTSVGGRQDRWVKFRAQKEGDILKNSAGVKLSRIRDGKYKASVRGFTDQITIEVEVKDRRIVSVNVVSHRESRALTSLQDVPGLIVAEQDVHVDATTGATVTSYAVMEAAAKALANAR